jgi:hypothetical protein
MTDQNQILDQILDLVEGKCTPAELTGIAMALLAAALASRKDAERVLRDLEDNARADAERMREGAPTQLRVLQ